MRIDLRTHVVPPRWEDFPARYGGGRWPRPRAYARRIYVDSLTLGPRNLRFVVEELGADRVVLGSDYLFDMGDPDPVGTPAAPPASRRPDPFSGRSGGPAGRRPRG